MMRRIILLLAAMMACSPPLHADSTLSYMRANITVVRRNVAPLPLLPWQDKTTPQEAPNPAIAFDIEVREATMLYRQEGWYNLSSPMDNNGVLMLLDKPGVMPINASPQYAALDILMIAPDGVISQIVPNIQLSALEQSIVPQSEVRGFLFIKGGMCEKLSIRPGDVVEYKSFKKAPVVLADPAAAPKEAPPAAQTKIDESRSAPLMMDTK